MAVVSNRMDQHQLPGAGLVELLDGTHTPFCSMAPGGQVIGGGGVTGTQIPFCSIEFVPQILEVGTLLFSTITQ